MTRSLIEHFERMQGWEAQASARSLASLDSVPQDGRTGVHADAYARGLGVMAHVQVARRVWLERLMGRPGAPGRGTPVPDWFPPWPTERTRREAASLDAEWTAYLARLTDADTQRECEYTSSEGVRFRSVVRDILAHVYNHSTYHRGQVARIVTECGGERAATDLIAFARTRL